MNKITKIILSLVIVGVVVFVGYKIVLKNNISKETGPIKIGFIGALSGNAAAVGVPPKQAMEIAVKEINARGGINGRKLEIVYEDAKCNGKDAVSAINKLIDTDKVQAIVGGQCSSETLAAAPIAEARKIVLVTPLSMSPKITNTGDYVFRTVFSDQIIAERMAECAVKNLGLRKFALLSEKTDYAQDYKVAFKNKLVELGAEIVSEEDFASDSTDLKTNVLRIKTSKPDAISFIPQTEAKAILGLKALNEARVNSTLLATMIMEKENVLNYSNSLNLDIYYSTAYYDTTSAGATKMFELYKNKFGKVDGIPYQMLNSYDTVYLLKDVMEKYGNDAAAIKNGLYKTANWQGVSGPISIDLNGDRTSGKIIVKHVENGKIVTISQ